MSIREIAWWPATDGASLTDETLGSLLDAQAERFKDHTAAVFVDTRTDVETRWTYGELKVATERLARALIGWGVNRGDHVAVMSPNRAEWILLEYALARMGAVLVTVNPSLQERELDYLLTQGRINYLIFADTFRKQDLASMLEGMMSGAGMRGQRGVASPNYPDLKGLCAFDSGVNGALSFSVLETMADEVSPEDLQRHQAAVKPNDVMQIQYTSGTTGKPKGAMLSHYSTVNNARLMSQRGGFRSDDVLLSAMPLFHTAGCVCNIMGMLACGGCVVVLDDFEPGAVLAQWEHHAATIINGVPTMYSRMMTHSDFARRRTDGLRLAFMGGTSIPPSLMQQVCDATGAQPMIIMGMTECSPIITQTDPDDPFDVRIATAGIPLPHTEVRIVDPDKGDPVGWGEKGELCIRGYLLTRGYFDMPEKSAETIDADGWLHSGDLAVLEKTGHLRIVGRLKDMIIRAGENVFPVEIEEFLLEHPAISQAQVVGVPDPDLGEQIFAFVLPAGDARLTADEIRDFCRANIARHKIPKYIHALSAFPMTSNGKIQKFALRELALSLIQEEVSL
ncbi:AMP-binding protein [Saccharospirillum alexandrii]|uniref:AMP-binding protein n=1 Tax=Saccharospirillum alexandrii TaxID=2448477 RepID=UPI000FDB8E87|nr:AMP-binding protein [Saccharospirillum alexandrii]